MPFGATTQTSCPNEKMDGDRPLHIMSIDQGFEKVTDVLLSQLRNKGFKRIQKIKSNTLGHYNYILSSVIWYFMSLC